MAAAPASQVFESTRPWNRLALAPLSMSYLPVTASAKTSAASASHPAALSVADRKVQSAYSPIVIAGVLRLIDFVLISLSGSALYFGYSTASVEDSWRYPILALSIAAATVAILQALDIYQVQHFQAGFLRIPRLLLCWCVVFIPAVGLSHVARLDDVSLRYGLPHSFVSELLRSFPNDLRCAQCWVNGRKKAVSIAARSSWAPTKMVSD